MLTVLLHKHIKRGRPRKKQELKPIDKLMYFVSFAYPLTAMPQLYKVLTTHNVESLALASWVLYLIFGSVFVVYAISRRLLPLIIEGSLWVVVYVLMVAAILIFR